jgi:hypothetical protein
MPVDFQNEPLKSPIKLCEIKELDRAVLALNGGTKICLIIQRFQSAFGRKGSNALQRYQ